MSMYMVGDMREKSYPEQKRPKSREKWMKVLRLFWKMTSSVAGPHPHFATANSLWGMRRI